MSTWLCEPPPGFDLPVIELDAPTRTIAILRLARELKLRLPEWRHAAVNYRITEQGGA